MTTQATKEESDTPNTDMHVTVRVDALGESHYVVPAYFARDQERELTAALKDAARYRWLREQRRWLYNKPPTPGISVRWENYIAGDADWLDGAIDAAIEKQS